MLINRNNYETFFLLYADDELRAEERIAVEKFVSENEDLRGELNLTLATVLPADEFSFILKDSLYKNSYVDGSFQEKLLLKIDHELSVEELNKLDKSILANPAALKEDQVLLTTKLDAAEIIICPNKESLFKKGRDTVVVFRMIRWAAAAILIGFGLFFGWSLYSKKSMPNNEVAVSPSTKPGNDQTVNAKVKKEQNITTNDLITVTKESIELRKTNTALTTTAESKKELENKSPVQKPEVVNKQELATNNEVQKTVTPVDKVSVHTVNDLQNVGTAKLEKVEAPALTNDNIVPLETSYVQSSFAQTDVSNNKILYMDEEDVKRSKVGTVFKQLKRMIERTAKIKTTNPIRIAGFQIGAD